MKYQTMFTQSDLAGVSSTSAPLTFPLGTVKGCSVRIDNQSPYGLFLYEGTNLADYVQPNSYVIMPLLDGVNLIVQVDPTTSSSVQQPYERVSYKLIRDVVSYQAGSIWQQNNATNIQNATIYTNTLVTNANTSPVYNQDAIGSYDQLAQTYNNSMHYNTLYTLLPSSNGGYIKHIYVQIFNVTNTSENGNAYIYLGSNAQVAGAGVVPLATSTTSASVIIDLDYGTGIVNNGVSLEVSATTDVAANSTYLVATVTYSHQTPTPQTYAVQ